MLHIQQELLSFSKIHAEFLYVCSSTGSAKCKLQQSWKIAAVGKSKKVKKEIMWIYFQQDKPPALSYLKVDSK